MNADSEVVALVREREGYQTRRDSEGVRLVDEQLAFRGFAVDAAGCLTELGKSAPAPAKKAAAKREKRPSGAPERAVEKR